MKRSAFLTFLSFLPFLKISAKHRSSFLKETCKTESDAEGPFYKKGAPARTLIENEGTKLTIRGRVLNASDCSTPVPNAILDIWHCDTTGKYDNNGFRCRGIVNSDSKGEYTFTTIYPPSYGSRPRHIHVKVRAKGFNDLTSQIYFKGDPNIRNDFARNADASRVIEVNNSNNGLAGIFDVYL